MGLAPLKVAEGLKAEEYKDEDHRGGEPSQME